MDTKKERLLSILKEKSYKYCCDPQFKLASGRLSPYYIDCKPTTNNAEGLTLIGEIIFEIVKDLDIKAIGGLTMGADPLAHATSVISYQKGHLINSFCVRKYQKDHGISKPHKVEGDVKPGEKVVILDDVITTGASTIEAIEAAENFGLHIVEVIVLIDRQEGGKQKIQNRLPGIEIESIFTLSDFIESKANEETSGARAAWGQSIEAHPDLR